VELALDDEITSDNYRTIPTDTPDEGVGIIEAPRGTLTHHYTTDDRGLLKSVNLIVGTTNNYAAIDMSIKKAAQSLIVAGQPVSDTVLNKIEMAFRTYDPCLGCATHPTTGESPLLVKVFDHNRTLVQEIRRD
jgi:F420-non-reducing hydrogenase large subunit